MTEITWTNCADEMPPVELHEVILSDGNDYYIFEAYMLHISWMKDVAVRLQHKWTSYSDAKWQKLIT